MLGEDNVLVREGVRALLDSYDDIEVVGVAEDAPSLLATAAEHVPDVVVTDIKMPPSFQLEGIDCAHSIRDRHPDTGVVVLSAHDDEEYALALLGKGHSGLAYLLKDRIAQGDELVRAIREVHAGGSAVDPLIAERLSGRERHRRATTASLLDMMAKGLGYAEMAAALGTTQEAVDRQVTELFSRMARRRRRRRAGGRVQAAARGRGGADRLAARPSRRSCPSQLADRLAAQPDARDRAAGAARSRCCSPTSAGSPRSPNGSARARSPPSSASTCRRWPRSSRRTAARSTSSRATR